MKVDLLIANLNKSIIDVIRFNTLFLNWLRLNVFKVKIKVYIPIFFSKLWIIKRKHEDCYFIRIFYLNSTIYIWH